MSVSVVLCAYADNRWDDLVAAVASIQRQDVPAEVVVVIDHNPALAERARTAFDSALILENSNPRGLSGARNAGINAASGEIVAFLDDDAVAEPGWLTNLLRPYREDAGVIGAGGAVVPLWANGRPSWFPREFDWVVGCTYRGLPEQRAEVRNPIGANMSFRAEVFDEVGLFRSGIGRVGSNAVGCEETELCIRVHQHWPERSIVYEPAAAVLHRVPAARATWNYFLTRCYAEGRSKAQVASLVGADDGLSSERTYTRRVLPLGIVRGIRAALTGDPSGAGRAVAIVSGFLTTAAGYARGRLARERVDLADSETGAGDSPQAEEFGPIRVLEVELSRPLPRISSHPVPGKSYARALLLVRIHGTAIGTVPLALDGTEVTAEHLAAEIQSALGSEILAHMTEDGVSCHPVLDAGGLTVPRDPACLRNLRDLGEDAPFISVVIPTRERPDVLAQCLETLRALEYPRFEVLVIDNGPTSTATRDLVQQISSEDARVHYIYEAVGGLSRAKNRGLAEARGEIVAFTDDDVLVDPLWLSMLARAFAVSPQIACVTGLIFPRELETVAQTWIEQFGGFGKGFQRRVYDMDRNRPPGILYPYTAGMFGSGANMAFRTPILRALGGFSLALGSGSAAMGGEDLAITYAAVMSGYGIVYEPSAIVHHLHHREFDRLRRQVYGYGVGLAAFVANTVAEDPKSAARLLRKLPLGVAYALNPWSAKNNKKADYPRELTLLEIRGMLYGPLAYWKSRRNLGKRTA